MISDETERTYPGSARELSRVVVHVVGALHVAHGKYARSVVGSESPIPNGVTAVAERQNVRDEMMKNARVRTWGKD